MLGFPTRAACPLGLGASMYTHVLTKLLFIRFQWPTIPHMMRTRGGMEISNGRGTTMEDVVDVTSEGEQPSSKHGWVGGPATPEGLLHGRWKEEKEEPRVHMFGCWSCHIFSGRPKGEPGLPSSRSSRPSTTNHEHSRLQPN